MYVFNSSLPNIWVYISFGILKIFFYCEPLSFLKMLSCLSLLIFLLRYLIWGFNFCRRVVFCVILLIIRYTPDPALCRLFQDQKFYTSGECWVLSTTSHFYLFSVPSVLCIFTGYSWLLINSLLRLIYTDTWISLPILFFDCSLPLWWPEGM